ncbi:serine/threonine-protein kinase [Glycomyces terrestris]|uniref:serine/threonine-protein kinase n=1 Tax=Glycomyces terrestris TaxID=2493553 RepID=UPI0013153AE4|nr:serine/threonine-protein kinase [Glycomyces terrestris]
MTAPSTAAPCAHCGGSIDAEGYCEDCGRRSVPAAGPASSNPPAAGPASNHPPTAGPASTTPPPAAAPCVHCGGAIDAEGYCEDCGRRAAPAALPSRPSTSSRRSTGRLGAGLADLPSVPVADPVSALMPDPAVPEADRHCTNGHPLAHVGRVTGFCPECGAPFDFTPALKPGDLVAGQYEIRGCLAHGGLGWIYLAADRNLDGKWVVLKGLLNTTDFAALAAAEAERRYLIAVDHPGIVKIHNFVQHRDTRDGTLHGYLVMEYIGGVSLADQLRAGLGERRGPVPPEWAIPCLLETLAAFDYLHNAGMVYCDLKPANLIQSGDRIRLIDLGAMRRIGDTGGDVWGTIGYQAPEINGDRFPDVASDLYTVGRTLAVLTLAFSPAMRTETGALAAAPLPPRPERYDESLYLFLERACHPDPASRFASAADMADQLTGVLRQIRAALDETPYPAVSAHFGPERGAYASAVSPDPTRVLAPAHPVQARRLLPAPLTDPADPAAVALAALAAEPPETAFPLVEALPRTPEARLAQVRLAAETGSERTDPLLIEAAAELGGDWRLDWYRGIAALGDPGRLPDAAYWFARVRAHLPGELAPLQALAISAEPGAAHHARVWRTDRGFTSAAFGLARGTGDFAALEAVPASSSSHAAARQALLAKLVRDPDVTLPDLKRAAVLLEGLTTLDRAEADLLEAELWRAAARVLQTESPDPQTILYRVPFTAEAVATAREAVLRRIAGRVPSPRVRWSVVGEANRVRPRTWL